MKKLVVYHLVTIIPIIVLLTYYLTNRIGIGAFAILFLLYGFIFRPIIDYYRLKGKGLVNRSDFIKSWGFVRFKYFYQLMFEK